MLPQIIYLCLSAASLTLALVKHGEPSGKYSFGWAMFFQFIMLIILYTGGFFAPLFR